jgi:hypothetical protein
MNKRELWTLYQWVRKRLTEEERKLIQSTKPNLLIATEREYAIQLKAKLALIPKIIEESTQSENRLTQNS